MTRPAYKALVKALLPLAEAASPDSDVIAEAKAALAVAEDALKARGRKYYEANKESIKAAAAAYRQRDIRAHNTKRRARYTHPECPRKGKSPDYAAKRIASGKAADYREQHRQEQRAWSKERSAAATESYARELLAKNSPLSGADFPTELVKLKQVEIKLRRLAK